MKKQISHISVHQTAKIFALLSFLMGIVGLIFTLFMGWLGYNHRLVQVPEGSEVSLDTMGPLLFLLPFIYLVLGYLVWLLVGFIYNIVAKYFGGIEFDLTDTE